MSTVRRIAKNTSVLLIAQIVSLVLGFFFTLYTARYLGAAGFGVLSFALAFTGMFAVLTDLGLGTLTTREIARDKSVTDTYFGNIVLMKTVLVVITFGLIALIVNLLGYPLETIHVVYLIGLSVIFTAFTGMVNSIFQALEKMEFQSVGAILNGSLLLFGALLAIKQGFGVIQFAFVYFIASVIVLIYGLAVYSWKFYSLRIAFSWEFWKKTFKEALPFGLSGLLVTIYYYVDNVILSLLVSKPNEVLGWYNAAYKVILVLLFIPNVYFMSVFPVMAKLFRDSEDALFFLFDRSFKYMTIIAVPIGVAVTLLANIVIPLLFGSDYGPSVIALQILVWSDVFIFMNLAFSSLLNSIGRQVDVTKVSFICMIVNIALNLVLIPRYSYVGSSAVTVITELTALLGVIIFARYQFSKIRVRGIAWKVIASSFLAGVLAYYLINVNILLSVLAFIALYFGVLFLLQTFDYNDKYLFKNLLRIGSDEENAGDTQTRGEN